MSKVSVAVVDYGLCNMLSVRRGLEYCGADVSTTSIPEEVVSADKIVLPGVGAFRNAMESLHTLGMVEVMMEITRRGKPLLGICLGMQLLLEESDEFGLTKGLELIPGRVEAIPGQTLEGASVKIPHIGWNELIPVGEKESIGRKIASNLPKDPYVYFVHSFMAKPTHTKHQAANCLYGGHEICGIIGKDNIVGCQFHPEKSGRVGLKVLRDFVAV